jgi:acyl-CoA reductase-like NAD-dependent aldehyde dehydrogenase
MPRTAHGPYKNYIGGKWAGSPTGNTFESISPANKTHVVGECQKSDHRDVRAAVDAAEEAFDAWAGMPAPKRGQILLKAAQIMKKEKKELGKLVTREMGKVLSEGLGDVQEAIDILEYMAGEGRRLFGNTTPSELPNKFCMTIRRPVGVMGLITPWNFPFAIPAWKIAPALICGNTMVFKPASDTPVCGIRFVEILEKAGVPPGVINLVTGSGQDVGTPIIKNEKIDGISFTGSRDVGDIVSREAGVKKVGLELGGKNPILIMPDADLALAVDGCIWGAFGTTGQRCTAASRVIVHEDVLRKFTRRFHERTKHLHIGDGLDAKTDVGPVINAAQLRKIHTFTDIGKRERAHLLHGGRILTLGRFGKGFFYEPTIFTEVTRDMTIAKEEIFGPTVCVMPAEDLDDAIDIANDVDYGLSSAIYTKDIDQAFYAIEHIDAGLTYVNSSTIGSEVHLPFGGVKKTGNGTREAGILGIDEFSEVKTVYVDYSGKLQKAQIDVD